MSHRTSPFENRTTCAGHSISNLFIDRPQCSAASVLVSILFWRMVRFRVAIAIVHHIGFRPPRIFLARSDARCLNFTGPRGLGACASGFVVMTHTPFNCIAALVLARHGRLFFAATQTACALTATKSIRYSPFGTTTLSISAASTRRSGDIQHGESPLFHKPDLSRK
jgi:hypothetical protein